MDTYDSVSLSLEIPMFPCSDIWVVIGMTWFLSGGYCYLLPLIREQLNAKHTYIIDFYGNQVLNLAIKRKAILQMMMMRFCLRISTQIVFNMQHQQLGSFIFPAEILWVANALCFLP